MCDMLRMCIAHLSPSFSLEQVALFARCLECGVYDRKSCAVWTLRLALGACALHVAVLCALRIAFDISGLSCSSSSRFLARFSARFLALALWRLGSSAFADFSRRYIGAGLFCGSLTQVLHAIW